MTDETVSDMALTVFEVPWRVAVSINLLCDLLLVRNVALGLSVRVGGFRGAFS